MALLNELTRIEKWIYTILSQDGTIASAVGTRIYPAVADHGATFPYIIFTELSPGEDVKGPGMTRIWAAPLYLIKAVTSGNSVQSLQTIADRIDQLFHGQKGGIADVTIQSSDRERPFRLVTVEPPGSANRFQHLGGEYRIKASPLVNP